MSKLFILVIMLVCVKRHLEVLIYLSLMTNKVEFFFHFHIRHLYLFFGECPFKKWANCILFLNLFIYSEYKSLTRYVIYKYFLAFWELSFTFLMITSEAEKFFILVGSNLFFQLFVVYFGISNTLKNHCLIQCHNSLILFKD